MIPTDPQFWTHAAQGMAVIIAIAAIVEAPAWFRAFRGRAED